MKLLLIGSTGLLGPAVAAEAAKRGYDVVGAARSGTDVALDVADEAEVRACLTEVKPGLVFNCAAMTDIAGCERDPGLAYRVNTRPLALLATWSRKHRRPLVHISTDHFFVEGGARPHGEADTVDLINVYARTKHAAESLALATPDALVLRTSIIGLRRRPPPTLAEWAIASIERGEEMTLFDDAFTSALDVRSCARVAFDLFERGATGLLNVGSHNVYSKGDLVRALARHLGRDLNNPRVGSVADLIPRRASSLGLNVRLAESRLGYQLPDLESVAAAVVEQYREST